MGREAGMKFGGVGLAEGMGFGDFMSRSMIIAVIGPSKIWQRIGWWRGCGHLNVCSL